MAENIIAVDTAILKTDVDSITAEIKGLRAVRQKIDSEVQQSGAMWDGTAKQAFMAAVQSDLAILDEITFSLTDLTGGTDDARTDYEKCEQSVSDIVSSIRI